ncbi:hypothetical protein [Epilithonimonas sp.]|uniref:hypothetical protein n=1 Tax=Epilithonimonas sp. TaxID=2894511 RepID=UPI0028AFD1A9|nr:hypothetical protein [Epilithonimonas sp.]
MIEKTTRPSKLKKTLMIIGGIILLLLLIFPFALDFYLKRKLPDLINDKTAYNVKLDDFNMSLFSGKLTANNIFSTNKNAKDSTVTQINGTVKELKIEDFIIWKAVFNKTYKAKDVVLSDPNIAVVFAPKKDKKNEKKKKTRYVNGQFKQYSDGIEKLSVEKFDVNLNQIKSEKISSNNIFLTKSKAV